MAIWLARVIEHREEVAAVEETRQRVELGMRLSLAAPRLDLKQVDFETSFCWANCAPLEKVRAHIPLKPVVREHRDNVYERKKNVLLIRMAGG